MAIVGAPPHPQALFAGFTADDPTYLAMAALVPTARVVTEGTMDNLREAEWDVVVSRRHEVDAPGHMHVLALGCEQLGPARGGSGHSRIRYGGKQPSQVLHIADDLPDTLRRLVMGELVPWLQRQSARPYLMTQSGTSGGLRSFGYAPESDTAPPVLHRPIPQVRSTPATPVPFVCDADGNMIAGAFPRRGSGWCWALPYVPDRPELWLSAALDDWHERTPARVPALPGWRARPRWGTQAESTVRASIAVLREEHARVVAEFYARESALVSAAAAATAAADAGLRRLITAQADDLVYAVVDALESLGYVVENVDDQDADASRGPRVEDLRVLDPDEPQRTNITEVRGYKGGAKASDLQRLARFASLQLLRTGQLPTSRWYIVNQFFSIDPDTRRPPLAGSEDDVAVFAEDGGLVIDTRDLLRLISVVSDGAMSSADARRMLRVSTGVFVLPDG